MRKKLILPALAAALLGLTACDFEDFGGLERYHSDFHFSYPMKAGGTLSLESFNGSVEISTWAQDTIDISGTKSGPTQQDADNLKVDIDHSPDSVSIRVPRPSYRRNNLGARFVIKTPRGVKLDRIITSNGAIRTMEEAGPARLRTSNGQVRVDRMSGPVDIQTSNATVELADVEGDATLHTSNGRVRVERLAGSLEAETSNSSVTVDVERPDRPVRVETSNGAVELTFPPGFRADVRAHTSNSGITVRLPADASARVSARTSNSSITSDFEVRMQGSFNKNYMDATIGAGGPLLDLTTSNGGIRLLRR